MGKRGPKATPTNTLQARGSWRAGTRKGEPTPPAIIPKCPEWLEGDARAEWDRLTKILDGQRIMTELDRSALAMHCQAYADYIAARKELALGGLTVATIQGSVKLNPLVTVMNMAWDRAIKSGALFGLSPSDRTRLSVGPKEEPSDPAEALLKRGLKPA